MFSDMTNLADHIPGFQVWERQDYWWSPVISRSLDAGIAASGIDKEEIDLYDFYS